MLMGIENSIKNFYLPSSQAGFLCINDSFAQSEISLFDIDVDDARENEFSKLLLLLLSVLISEW